MGDRRRRKVHWILRKFFSVLKEKKESPHRSSSESQLSYNSVCIGLYLNGKKRGLRKAKEKVRDKMKRRRREKLSLFSRHWKVQVHICHFQNNSLSFLLLRPPSSTSSISQMTDWRNSYFFFQTSSKCFLYHDELELLLLQRRLSKDATCDVNQYSLHTPLF